MLVLQAILFGLKVACVAAAGRQAYLSSHNLGKSNILAGQSYDEGLFTPLESLELLSESQFTTLGHPMFPYHSVRIKKTRFCDETVRYEIAIDFCLINRWTDFYQCLHRVH